MKTILCILLFFVSTVLQGAFYYVSTTGSNSNPGTFASPFLTIQKGIDEMSGGDTLYVRGGVYSEKLYVELIDGTYGNRTAIMAYPSESPIIDADGLTIGNGSQLVRIYDDYVTFSGFELKNINTDGETTGGNGIISTGVHVIISHCTVHDVWDSGIHTYEDSTTIEYCTVYNTCLNNSADPGSIGNGSGISATKSPGDTAIYCTLKNNIVHDTWGEGISCFRSAYTIIQDNTIYDNWSVNLYLQNSQHCTAQRNFIYRTKDMTNGSQVGIFIGDEVEYLLNNYNTVINNIVSGCRKNLYTGILRNTLISNNTFVNSVHIAGVQIDDAAHVTSSFVNNIVIQDGALPVVYGFGVDADLVRNHNLWSKTPVSTALGTGDVVNNPYIVKVETVYSSTYYQLQSISPAINSGYDAGIVLDYGSVTRDANPDIGAWEYVSGYVPIIGTGSIITKSGKIMTTNNKIVKY